MASVEGDISSWPEAVQPLFKNQTQMPRISSAVATIHVVSRRPTELEQELVKRLYKDICRCGNVHPPEKVLTLSTGALDPTSDSVVPRYRALHRQAA